MSGCACIYVPFVMSLNDGSSTRKCPKCNSVWHTCYIHETVVIGAGPGNGDVQKHLCTCNGYQGSSAIFKPPPPCSPSLYTKIENPEGLSIQKLFYD